MTTTKTIAEQVAHDEKLLELFATAQATDDRRANAVRYASDEAGRHKGWRKRNEYRSNRPFWVDEDNNLMTLDAVISVLGEIAAGDEKYGHGWSLGSIEATRYLDSLTKTRLAQEASTMALMVHEADYTGWNRYYLVTSSPGHVHKTVHCSSCFNTTRFAPLPSLSGTEAANAVALLGETLCTVCFPDAPVKPAKITQAQASKLLNEGEAAFHEMRAKAAAKKKAAQK